MAQVTKRSGGVTAAQGFQAIGIAAGIKKKRKDMAMIYSAAQCAVAGTFTTNLVKAAPVKWDQQIAYGNKTAQAVVVNSGVANACTGEEGMRYCRETAQKAASLFGIEENKKRKRKMDILSLVDPVIKII